MTGAELPLEYDHRAERTTPTVLWFVLGVLSITTILAVAAVWRSIPERWDPLGEFAEQDVNEVTPTEISTTGTKCYDERVNVIGSFWWQTVEPPGTIAALKTGAAADRFGCITNTFVNLIPDEVLELDEALGGAVWIITGQETPIDPVGGREGLPHTWRTRAFEIPRPPRPPSAPPG